MARRGDGRRRSATSRTSRSSRGAPAPAGRADRRAARRVLHDRAGRRHARSRAICATSTGPPRSRSSGNLARRDALRRRPRRGSTPTSTSSRSRPPRSTSSPRPPPSAGIAVVFADNESSPLAGQRTSTTRSRSSRDSAGGSRCRRRVADARAPRCRRSRSASDGLAVLEGPDGPRADRGRRRAAERRLRAGAARIELGPRRQRPARSSTSTASRSSPSRCSARPRATARSRRLRRYRELQELDTPLIVLVGGATGTGQVDGRHRGRVPARDHPRHVHRLRPPDDARVLLPRVHAVDPLLELRGRRRAAGARGGGDPPLAGFLEQTRNVLVGVRAALERALQEGWSMVLEGVHLVPGPACRGDRGRARRPVRARDRRRGEHARPLLRPRRRVGRACGRSTSTSTRFARDPPDPGPHRRARAEAGGAGDRERRRRAGDRQGHGARPGGRGDVRQRDA